MRGWVRAAAGILSLVMAGASMAGTAGAQDTAYPPEAEQIPGPNCAPVLEWNLSQAAKACSRVESDAWLADAWPWTDEFVDEHTAAAALRGGSHYQPQGSKWYFPQAYKLSEHGKYLLMAPGMDRSGAIGFRCVMDVAGEGASTLPMPIR